MKGYGALYAIRRPADQSVLYIGQTQNMWRRLYTKRNDHEGIAYFFGEGIDYEIAYWHKPITEQDRLIAEIELTAQWRPWWIYDFPLEQRREWTTRYEIAADWSRHATHQTDLRCTNTTFGGACIDWYFRGSNTVYPVPY